MALIARWRFEPGANLWVDSSGNSNTLTPAAGAAAPTSDTSWRVEGQGSAKFVRASSQRALITDANQGAGFPCRHGDGGSAVKIFSICAWIKLSDVTNNMGICNRWPFAADAASRSFSMLTVATTGRLTINGRDTSGNEATRTHATDLSTGTTYFVSAGYQETDGYVFLRVRNLYGNIIGTDYSAVIADTWDGINVASFGFYVGAMVQETGSNFDGYIDDLRVYSNEYHTATQTTQICRQSSGLAGKRLMMGG